MDKDKTKIADLPPLQIAIKVSPKRAVSLYGLQRMPITLYAGQWLSILTGDTRDKLLEFIAAHKEELAWKEGQEP
jgi:hypothetical protein